MEEILALPNDIDHLLTEKRNAAWEAEQKGDWAAAAQFHAEAWALFGEPRHRWNSSQIVLIDIASFYLNWRKFPEAEHWAKEVFKCEPLANDPSPHLLLGKIYLEAGHNDLAAQNLHKAFELGGRRGFVGEDPKYLKFALEQMKKEEGAAK